MLFLLVDRFLCQAVHRYLNSTGPWPVPGSRYSVATWCPASSLETGCSGRLPCEDWDSSWWRFSEPCKRTPISIKHKVRNWKKGLKNLICINIESKIISFPISKPLSFVLSHFLHWITLMPQITLWEFMFLFGKKRLGVLLVNENKLAHFVSTMREVNIELSKRASLSLSPNSKAAKKSSTKNNFRSNLKANWPKLCFGEKTFSQSNGA